MSGGMAEFVRFVIGGKFKKKFKYIPDPKIFSRASIVRGYYSGYKYVVEFTYHSALRNNETVSFAKQWCKENCIGGWRSDIHRVIASADIDWDFNEIGGYDAWFWAFENEQDAIMFSLTWL